MTKEISNNNKKYLIFGGPYSNLQALQSLQKMARDLGYTPEQIICTGDIVGYCANPSEAVDFVQDWGIHCILGNVEMSLLDEADDCGCNFNDGSRCDLFSRQWFPFAQSKITKKNLNFIESLPEFIRLKFENTSALVLHGSHNNTGEFIFKSTPWSKKMESFESSNSQVIIAGHCGLPFAHRNKEKLWLNAGVIGMPANNGEENTWFATVDFSPENPQYKFISLDYNQVLANQLMLQNPLPKTYAETLITGIWDNCEILPEKETLAQGKMIDF